MSIRNPILRRTIGIVFTLAGLAYLLYARFGHFDAAQNDNQRLCYTVGIAFLILGPVFALTGKRGENGQLPPLVSGVRLIAVGALLGGLGSLFLNQMPSYLTWTLIATGVVLGVVGMTRLLTDLTRKR